MRSTGILPVTRAGRPWRKIMSQLNSEIPEVKPPKCPHCKADMPRVNQYSWGGSAGWLILAVYCESCSVLLKMAIVPVMQQSPDDPGESRIARVS